MKESGANRANADLRSVPDRLPPARSPLRASRVRRFLRLSREDRGTFFLAFFLLPLTAAGLRLFGYRRWHAFLASRLPSLFAGESSVAQDSHVSPERAAQMVDAAAREGFHKGTCLERSLVLWWLLRRRQVPAQICIGARKTASVFEAHAWVQVNGTVINDTGEVHEHYAPFEGASAVSGKSR